MGLNGYIAEPNGEADWMIMDPDIDFVSFAATSSRQWDSGFLCRGDGQVNCLCAHPLEKSVPAFADTSIHRLHPW